MLLEERYELVDRLGPGASAPYAAIDRETGDECVVRELTLGRLTDWKQLDLFERETNALRQLDHPGVPRFIDALRHEGENGPRFYLVQSRVPGESAATRVGTLGEQELIDLATRTLEILKYLQSFTPPVLHRDIKPDNILIDDSGNVALVDFGSVQVELQGTSGGSTVVGTSGYMAPEQLMGRAVPASDVYALGATLIHVMTGTHPSELPMERMRPQWRRLASGYSSRFLDVVDRMVAPNPKDRFANANEVLRALGGGAGALVSMSRPGEVIRASRPTGTDIELTRTARRLVVETPPNGLGRVYLFATFAALVLGAGFAGILFDSGMVFTQSIAISGAASLALAVVIGWVIRRTTTGGRIVLDVDRGYRVKSTKSEAQLIAGPFSNVIGPDKGYGGQQRNLYLVTDDGHHEAAQGLSPEEQDWLMDEIADFIRENRG